MTVVRIVTISRTNITGFLMSVRGSSLTNAEPIAGTMMPRSNNADTGICLRSVEVSIRMAPTLVRREGGTGSHREMLDDGSERQRREESKAADDENHADDQADEQTARGRERAGGRGHGFLRRERTGDGQRRDDHPETPNQHRNATGDVIEQRVAGETCERRAVVTGLGGVGIKHLGEAVRTRVRHRGHGRWRNYGDR